MYNLLSLYIPLNICKTLKCLQIIVYLLALPLLTKVSLLLFELHISNKIYTITINFYTLIFCGYYFYNYLYTVFIISNYYL